VRRFTKLDPWVRALLVDPFGKGPLAATERGIESAYGRAYPMVGGIPDLRRPYSAASADAATWRAGQEQYEAWSQRLVEDDAHQDYAAEIDGVREVYADIVPTGRVLDVGGHQGRLREFLAPGQEYLSCDPYLDVFAAAERQSKLLKAYRCLAEPCNFVAAHAEHLPLAEASFDTVHMRSVIDHFRDPALALIEAHRVLRNDGALVVGLYVEGGRSGRMSTRETAKELVRAALPWVGVTRYSDHHVWHPTYAALTELIERSGFSIDKVHWQRGWNERVCYVRARKRAA
jgi:ubiquinone/menaquinone biosynthesis C-methylase UbiE